MGVSVKMITGDNPLVAASVGEQVGLSGAAIVTAKDLHELSDEALRAQVNTIDIFAEIEPNQKERIILALRKAGNVVGYMGDGINDASALHAADVGISVNTAADVAKEAADFVLLEKDLAVLGRGVRRRQAHLLEHPQIRLHGHQRQLRQHVQHGRGLAISVLPAPSSQAGPAHQPHDRLSRDDYRDRQRRPGDGGRPPPLGHPFIRRFMLVFGLLSSVFDYATFGVLLLILHASPTEFRTGWFIESVASASLVVLVIRTRRPIFRSVPSWKLLTATVLVVAVVIVLPFTPLSGPLGLAHIPAVFFAALAGILALYAVGAEIAKWLFYRAHERPAVPSAALRVRGSHF